MAGIVQYQNPDLKTATNVSLDRPLPVVGGGGGALEVETSEEEAVLGGRAFIGSTAVAPVVIGNIMAITISNPAGSGKNMFLTNRRFSSTNADSDPVLEYLAYVNPTIVLSTAAAMPNRRIGGPATAMVMRYQVAPAASLVMGGVSGSGESIRNGGGATERRVMVIVPPGQTLGFTVTGSGNNLSHATRLSVSLEWYEEAA